MTAKDAITAVRLDHWSGTVSAKSQISVALRLKIFFWCLAALLGALHAWHHRYSMNPDGIAYLDMGDAYLRGDWSMAINAYWSPFYSWLLGLAMLALKPSSYWEFPLVHLVNFIVFLWAFGCFHLLLRELLRYHRQKIAECPDKSLALPEWGLQGLGYSFFIWSAVDLIGVGTVTPDMCVAAFVYLASAMILRIRRKPNNWFLFALLGAILGLGYFAKAAMFPLAFVFLGMSFFSVASPRKALPYSMVALMSFLFVAGPFVFTLSKNTGHLTFGQAGALNHAWFVTNKGPRSKYPTEARRIFDQPTVLEFDSRNQITYPLWYDPSYWYKGNLSRNGRGADNSNRDTFRLYEQAKRQAQTVIRVVNRYIYLLFAQEGLLIGLAILYTLGRRRWAYFRDILAYWPLLVPAVAGLGMYALVLVHTRLIGAFVALLLLSATLSVRLPRSQEMIRLVNYVSAVLVILMVVKICNSSRYVAYDATQELIATKENAAYVHWEVAEKLKQLGLRAGDKVAVIADTSMHYWARLARVKIVAELFEREVADFWAADQTIKSQIISTFASTGAKAVIADVSNRAPGENWERLANSNWYIYSLQ